VHTSSDRSEGDGTDAEAPQAGSASGFVEAIRHRIGDDFFGGTDAAGVTENPGVVADRSEGSADFRGELTRGRGPDADRPEDLDPEGV
jgi:hypothetical protein